MSTGQDDNAAKEAATVDRPGRNNSSDLYLEQRPSTRLFEDKYSILNYLEGNEFGDNNTWRAALCEELKHYL